jgi:hypothetical protein
MSVKTSTTTCRPYSGFKSCFLILATFKELEAMTVPLTSASLRDTVYQSVELSHFIAMYHPLLTSVELLQKMQLNMVDSALVACQHWNRSLSQPAKELLHHREDHLAYPAARLITSNSLIHYRPRFGISGTVLRAPRSNIRGGVPKQRPKRTFAVHGSDTQFIPGPIRCFRQRTFSTASRGIPRNPSNRAH